MDIDEVYQTVIDGLRVYLQEPFVGDVLRVVSRYPQAATAHSLNKNQMASKRWLVESLANCQPGRLDNVYLLGGWYGVLGAMLLSDTRFDVGRIFSLDLDPDCRAIAETLNQRHLADGRFNAVTRDMMSLALRDDLLPTRSSGNGWTDLRVTPDLLINTSCEHLPDFAGWYDRIPDGMLLTLQSNDYFECDEHVACVADLAAFRHEAPMRDLLFAGSLPLKRYNRFMLIGRK